MDSKREWLWPDCLFAYRRVDEATVNPWRKGRHTHGQPTGRRGEQNAMIRSETPQEVGTPMFICGCSFDLDRQLASTHRLLSVCSLLSDRYSHPQKRLQWFAKS